MTDASVVHSTLVSMAEERARSDYELGRWLAAAHRLRVFESAGYGSFGEYVERLFGFSRRMAQERLRVALALEGLPELTRALQAGEVSWSAAREVTRVANAESDEEWVGAASGKTAREVERMVAGLEDGARPFDVPTAEPPVRMSFTVSGPVRALVQEARERLCVSFGERVDDDALMEAMARALLGGQGSRDEGQSSYQIALTVCPRCSVGTQRAGADDVVVDEATLEKARCDAQELGRVDVAAPRKAAQSVAPRVRRAVLRRHGGRCAVPGCRQSGFVDVHHVDRRADGGDHGADNLVVLCGTHHDATHVGTLVIRGRYSTGFSFEHADGATYGAPTVSPARGRVLSTVLALLVGMGFKQREAQGMLDRVKGTHVGGDGELRVEDVLRAALQAAPVAGYSSARTGASAAGPSGGVRERLAVYERLVA